MKSYLVFFAVAYLGIFAKLACAEEIIVAAAADLKFAIEEVSGNFMKRHPQDKVTMVFGSSGKLYAQIQQGAPYDLFFSADIAYPRDLVAKKMAVSEVFLYAIGRIALWSTNLDSAKLIPSILTDPAIKRVAIANPKHAPYGRRAEEALRKLGLWSKVEPKLVFGEDISQTAEFVRSGNAQVGVIALSIVSSPQLAKLGSYWLIPKDLHEPLEQGYVILKNAEKKGLARRFSEFMSDQSTRAVMTKFGFVVNSQNK